MRIPDDIEDLVFSFMEPELKKELRWMTRAEIDELIVRKINCALEPGYVEKCDAAGAFPYRITAKGKAILQILAPCKRSGR
jgi:hypothetical protein